MRMTREIAERILSINAEEEKILFDLSNGGWIPTWVDARNHARGFMAAIEETNRLEKIKNSYKKS